MLSDNEDVLRLYQVAAKYGDSNIPQPQNLPSGLNVAVIAGSGRGIASEMRSIKAALLYADQVRVYSIPAYMAALASFCHPGDTREEKANFVWDMGVAAGMSMDGFSREDFVAAYAAGDSDSYVRLRENLAPLGDVELAGELEASIRSGLVSVQPYEGKTQIDLAVNYLASLSEAINDRGRLPMFDFAQARILREAFELGTVKQPSVNAPFRRNAALAADLMGRLPIIDADIELILEAREELNPYVRGFRGALASFSTSIASEPWEEDFKYDAEQVFIEKVGPAIQEIEAGIRNVRPIAKYLSSVGFPFAASGTASLAVAVGAVSQIPALAGVAGLAGTALGVANVAAKAYDSIRAEEQKVEGNHLYMYYQASKIA